MRSVAERGVVAVHNIRNSMMLLALEKIALVQLEPTKVGSVEDVLVEYNDTGTETNPSCNVDGGVEAGRFWLLRPFNIWVDGRQHRHRSITSRVDRGAGLFV
jgi:hypothetical protein